MRRQTEDKCVDSKSREACGGNMDDEAHNGAYGNTSLSFRHGPRIFTCNV